MDRPSPGPRQLVGARTRLATRLASPLAVALLLLGGGLAQAQSLPRFIDCGDLNGFPTGEPGWELMTETSTPPGVSLSPPALDTAHTGHYFHHPLGGVDPGLKYPIDVISCDPDQLGQTHRHTALQLADFSVLAFDGLAPSRDFRLRLELGSLSPWVDFSPGFDYEWHENVSREVRVETRWGAQWRTAARDIRCATGELGNSLATDASGIVTLWVVARSDAGGTLRVRLSTDGGDPLFLAGVSLYEHEPLPVVYRRAGAGSPMQANSPGLAAFAAAFDPADLTAAEAEALALSDPFERGAALAHLLGWLDGSEAGAPLHLRDAARAALTEAAGDHPAAVWLLDELLSFERALDHLAAGGYAWARACPGQGGFGFFNPDCTDPPMANAFVTTATANVNAHVALRELAGLVAPADGPTVLHDLASWNAGAPSLQPWEPSPFVFAAARFTATTLIDLNPNLSVVPSDPESALQFDTAGALFDAFEQLGFAATEAPRDLEQRLFRRMLELGVHPRKWELSELQTLFTPAELDAAWWAEHVALAPADPNAPLWANLQRDQRRITRELARWWVDRRLQGHELGGGWGDDVELLGQLVQPLAAYRDQTDRRLLDAFDEMARYGLAEQGLVQDGYYAGAPTDAQHSAEFTTNPWLALRILSGHSPRMLETALGVTRHLRDLADPATAFAAPTNLGRLHFRAYVYTAEGPSDNPAHALDRLQTGRSLVPGLGLASTAGIRADHPLVDDLSLWAETLRLDALDGNGGKPLGWFAPTQWPSNAFGAVGGPWYSESGSASDASIFSKSLHAYGLDGLHMVARHDAVPDAWRHLVPAARMFRAVIDWEDAGSPSGSTGSDAWVASAFKGGGRFGPLVVANLAALRDEPRLRTELDPQTGAPYVDDAFVERMRFWVETEFNGQTNALRYALPDTSACGQGPVKPTNSLWAPYENWLAYARAAWPMFTRHVLHTDRAFLQYNGGGHGALVAAASGAVPHDGVTFAPLISWESRLDGGLDLALQLNDRAYDGTLARSWVHNFDDDVAALALRLEAGLPAGRYLVSWGPADEGCDALPVTPAPASSVVHKFGAGAALLVDFAPGLNLVEVRRLGDTTPPADWELSVDPPSIEIRKAPGTATGWSLAFTTRVANRGGLGSPGAQVDWYASFLGLDGELLVGDGLAPEIPLGSTSVAALPGLTGWQLPGAGSEVVLPLTQGLAQWLLLGLGLQVRVVVHAAGDEGDTLDNVQARGWYLPQMAVVLE